MLCILVRKLLKKMQNDLGKLNLMELVVDANILVSGLIKDGITRELMLSNDLDLYTSDFIFIELFKHIKEIAQKAGITKYVAPYIIKPSSITLDFNKQVNPKIIQRKARHRKIETTLRYDHVSDDMVREYFEKMNLPTKYTVDNMEHNQEVGYF